MGCSRCKFQNKSKLELPCLECTQNRATDHWKPMTNADRIRNMSDEELAKFICKISLCKPLYCPAYRECMESNGCMLKWLQAEVESCE